MANNQPARATRNAPRSEELGHTVAPDRPVLLACPPAGVAGLGIPDWLASHGWSSIVAADAERARWLAAIQKLSLVLVVGDNDFAVSVLRAIRKATMAPIVVLPSTMRSDVVAVLDAGADAVIDPATSNDELFARVVALMHRSEHHAWAPGTRHLRAGALHLDLLARTCSVEGALVHLSPTEYELLSFLMAHPRQALSVQLIVQRVWGGYAANGKNVVRIFINHLRQKLAGANGDLHYIETVRGTGYRFALDVSEISDDVETSIERSDVAVLLDSITSLAASLQLHDSIEDAAEQLVEILDSSDYADGISLSRVDGDHMTLVASRRMPAAWLERVAAGVPLKSTFASAQSVLSGKVVQFKDVRQMTSNFPDTVDRASITDYRACLFVPIVCRGTVWGTLGLVRRSSQAFDPTGTAYLNAVCGVFALAMRS